MINYYDDLCVYVNVYKAIILQFSCLSENFYL